MRVEFTRPFRRDYERLPAEVRERADKQLTLLITNPRHPSLRLKRLRGTDALWEVRITRGYRATLEMSGDLAILRRLGTHDVLREP